MWRKRNIHAVLVGMQTGAATVKVWTFLKKLKIDLPFDPAILLLGIYPKNKKTPCTPMFVTLFTIGKIWKQPKCPSIDECLKKLWCTYTHTYTRNFAFCNDINGAREYNAMQNKSVRERQIPYDFTDSGIKKQMSKGKKRGREELRN